MITLNLLPPNKKQELQLARLYTVIKNLIVLILLLTIIIAITLLFTKITLQNHFNKIVEQTTLTTKFSRLFNKDIRAFNKQLAEVEKIQKDYISWINFFVKFNKLVPEEVSIYDLSLNNDKILITGLAKTREKLLFFKNNLENSDLFSEVVVPLENILKKENIDFNIKADINLGELKIDYDN